MSDDLPPDYEKSYLDLLYDYHSDETKKTRRNLSVAGFVVVAIHLAGVPVSKLKLPYVDSGDTNPTIVVLLAIILLLYWSAMLIFHTIRDRAVQAERKHRLTRIEEDIDQRLKDINQRIGKSAELASVYGETKGRLERGKKVIAAQRERTKRAGWWNSVIPRIEYITTVLLAAFALFYLGRDFVTALVQGW